METTTETRLRFNVKPRPPKTPVKLVDFMRKHDLEMNVIEGSDGRWTTWFVRVELVEDGLLKSVAGYGETRYEALSDYLERIKGKDFRLMGSYTTHTFPNEWEKENYTKWLS